MNVLPSLKTKFMNGQSKLPKAIEPAVFILISIAVLWLFSGCSKEKPHTKETFVMGTIAQVTIYGLSEDNAENAAREALRELHRIESVMSTWKSDSEISRLNRESQGRPYPVSQELFSLLDSSFYYSNVTGGAFDITARPLVKLWGFQGGVARLPTDEEIEMTRERVGFEKVILDHASSTITLPPGMELDLAGVAKGYAVDRSAQILEEHGVKNALINLGGNIYAIGTPPHKNGWTIGIRDPLGSQLTVGSLILRNESVATSGSYENYVKIDDKKYGHIINPTSGRPVENVLSVTVIAPTALATDALSTGLFVLGPDRGKEALRNMKHVKAIYATRGERGIQYTTIGDFGGKLRLDQQATER